MTITFYCGSDKRIIVYSKFCTQQIKQEGSIERILKRQRKQISIKTRSIRKSEKRQRKKRDRQPETQEKGRQNG